MLSEVFWVAFVATTSAMVCGGRIRIIRDIDAEVKEEEIRVHSKDKEETSSS
jgi:hypothetical protein